MQVSGKVPVINNDETCCLDSEWYKQQTSDGYYPTGGYVLWSDEDHRPHYDCLKYEKDQYDNWSCGESNIEECAARLKEC